MAKYTDSFLDASAECGVRGDLRIGRGYFRHGTRGQVGIIGAMGLSSSTLFFSGEGAWLIKCHSMCMQPRLRLLNIQPMGISFPIFIYITVSVAHTLTFRIFLLQIFISCPYFGRSAFLKNGWIFKTLESPLHFPRLSLGTGPHKQLKFHIKTRNQCFSGKQCPHEAVFDESKAPSRPWVGL